MQRPALLLQPRHAWRVRRDDRGPAGLRRPLQRQLRVQRLRRHRRLRGRPRLREGFLLRLRVHEGRQGCRRPRHSEARRTGAPGGGHDIRKLLRRPATSGPSVGALIYNINTPAVPTRRNLGPPTTPVVHYTHIGLSFCQRGIALEVV